MKEVKNLCTLVGVDCGDIFLHLNKLGEWIIPVEKTICKSGMARVKVVEIDTEKTTQAIVIVGENEDSCRDMRFNGMSYEWFTKEGEKPNWESIGLKTPKYLQKRIDFNLSLTPYSFDDKSVDEMICEIRNKEPEAAKAIEMSIKHIYNTYSDKYAKGENIIDTKKMLYDKERGDFLNIYQVNRYLQRYITSGSKKSHLVKDIEKAIHYLIFELTRRIKLGDYEEIEPKV